MSDRFYIHDEEEESSIRFVSFMGDNDERFDLALISTERYYGKQVVLDIRTQRFALLGVDDLEEQGLLEDAYQIDEETAEELRAFLLEAIVEY
ncbi:MULTISPECIES: DUF3055 domain-containing protein [Sinobaca]|uniref:DUF3055 family protein n=1 Tax=Sinobaca qinghaiensis TaxID=342944 RepID=A0A419UW95_9BACL|nr:MULTISPECIES: DUF3055 domain-containing protein [Sinobaca]RKD68838.1 Protein of unknown function (DUF3055) [Sinobaca qinghaiensis]